MSNKTIFVATHPRACSSAFERVFLTRQDMEVFHEPFGECYYHGRETLGTRYREDEKCHRLQANPDFVDVTFKQVFDRIEQAGSEGKRVFVKDMAYYLIPPENQPAKIAPSLLAHKRGVGTTNGNGETQAVEPSAYPYGTSAESGNPTVVPDAVLSKIHFAFLIRHPRSSIPSYYFRCVPPQSEISGFAYFMPSEAGYAELVRLFDHLCAIGQVKKTDPGAVAATTSNGTDGAVDVCVIDADDLLDDPDGVTRAFCNSVGVDYRPDMLTWDSEHEQARAVAQFEKWPGWHDDALESTCLRKREHRKKPKSDEELFAEWTEAYGKEGAEVIRKTVEENVPHYEYLSRFTLKAENLPN